MTTKTGGKGKKFECYKSYVEFQTFHNEDSIVRVEQIWRYATLVFPPGEVPKPNADGHYIDISCAYLVEYGDPKDDEVTIKIKDKTLRQKVEFILENEPDYEEALEALGFCCSTRVDLRPSRDGWARITVSDA